MREFLHVDDMADASLFVHNLDQVTYKKNTQTMLSHINVGTGVDVTIKELAQTVQSIIGFEGYTVFDQTKPDGTPRKLMDVNLLSTLGWRAQIDLRAGLTSAYQDFIQNHCVKID
jgi:GDP-L-fucose synthase